MTSRSRPFFDETEEERDQRYLRYQFEVEEPQQQWEKEWDLMYSSDDQEILTWR